jgi:hypothetical protein
MITYVFHEGVLYAQRDPDGAQQIQHSTSERRLHHVELSALTYECSLDDKVLYASARKQR